MRDRDRLIRGPCCTTRPGSASAGASAGPRAHAGPAGVVRPGCCGPAPVPWHTVAPVGCVSFPRRRLASGKIPIVMRGPGAAGTAPTVTRKGLVPVFKQNTVIRRRTPLICQACGHVHDLNDPLTYFWTLVIKGPGPACWVWHGVTNKAGYGIMPTTIVGERLAHRYIYTTVHGPIPTGFIIRHTCDTPACVRPDHLLIGTHIDNSNDMTLRQRRHVRENSPFAKLNWSQVREIRRLRHEEGVSFRKLAAAFNMSTSAVRAIFNGRSWNDDPATQ
jgi:DNA-binding transcriptional regulator YiaG